LNTVANSHSRGIFYFWGQNSSLPGATGFSGLQLAPCQANRDGGSPNLCPPPFHVSSPNVGATGEVALWLVLKKSYLPPIWPEQTVDPLVAGMWCHRVDPEQELQGQSPEAHLVGEGVGSESRSCTHRL
jgi:hypothetical protein